ncbi:hypothetical protein [Haloarcula amylovorans]|uniref:hypothetical protein n=1 Tax=Haloarcula amylovorans TaxID=2562280 RepID=UPI0010768A3E|nr:hypothetical protein [Halomicroarcula amylolytica]
MGLDSVLDLSDTTERRLVRGLQLALVVLGGYGLLNFEVGIAAAAVVGLGISFVPALLRREYDYAMNGGLVLWITVAVFLHSVGSLGIYGQYQWYDEITHTVSSALIAALGYAAFRALELHSDEISVPDEFRAVFIVVFVLAFGIVWEVLEFALGDFIPVYGIDDIVTDMIANTVGAVIVAVWGAGPVSGLIGFFRERL